MITNKKRKLQFTVFFVVGSFIAAHLLFQLLPSVFEAWNAKAIDQLFLFRSNSEHFQPTCDDTIIHVDLTDTDLERLKNPECFYVSRSQHARVIRNLASMNVAIQMYDFVFAARLSEADDVALIDATRKAGNVYLGLAFTLADAGQLRPEKTGRPKAAIYLDRTKWRPAFKGDPTSLYTGFHRLTTFPALASASRGLGYINLLADRDGVYRRLPLLVRYKDAFYPSFALQAVCAYLGVSPENITVRPGKDITLRGARRPGESEDRDTVIPIDRQSNMVINFVGPWERMEHRRFSEILDASDDLYQMEMWKEELEGKIVVVSEVTTGLSDIGPVPTDARFPLSGVHANAIHTILTESFLREISSPIMFVIELFLLAVVLFLSLRFSSLYFSLGSLVVAISYVGVVVVSFLYGNLIFHVVRPLIIVAFAVFSIVAYRYFNEEKEKLEGLRQRDFIRATFGRYLSDEVVEELLGSAEGLKMSGEMREVSFLVSDLRGFTALSSRLSPPEVVNILNRFLERMIEIIDRYKGTVNEIEGDGILGFFGAPLTSTDDTERAVACAIEMQKALVVFNEEQRRLNLPELAMGIGINTGEVVVGNIGSEKRAKYSAIGAPINTAYRIESYTVGGQILISSSTYEKVRSLVSIKGTIEAHLKGISHPITLYDVAGIEGDYQLFLSENGSDVLMRLEPPLPIQCFPIEGKQVSEKGISGLITQLGSSSAEVSLEEGVAVRYNLKILLEAQDDHELSEIYAKVVSLDNSDSNSSNIKAHVDFTWLSDDVKAYLSKKRSEGEG